jgi:SAM-dependent methyltransferase
MSEYTAIFDARGGHYNLATHRHPLARAEEARAILAHLELPAADGTPWLDLAAGGGYLADRARAEGIGPPAVACDASLPFLVESAGYRGRALSQYERLPFSDRAFSAAGCLAALHHADEPAALAAEMLRVIAPGRRAAIGDVAPGSPAAAFLNDFVHWHTDTGHRGRFASAELLSKAFASAGGRRIRDEERELAWRFPSRAAAGDFCRELFGLRPATSDAEIADGLSRLGLAAEKNSVYLPWRMIFVSAER